MDKQAKTLTATENMCGSENPQELLTKQLVERRSFHINKVAEIDKLISDIRYHPNLALLVQRVNRATGQYQIMTATDQIAY